MFSNIQSTFFKVESYISNRASFFVMMLVIFSLWGCTKIIEVNLNDADPQVVIEANVQNTPGPYYVQISKTVNFSASNQFPPITGAKVIIQDITGGVKDTLTELQQGLYMTQRLTGVAGRTYQLDVTAGGKNFTAVSKMPAAAQLDSVSFEKISRPGSKTDWYAVINYQDPAGINNYYLFTLFVNGRRINNTFVYDDRFTDGRYVSRTLRTDSAYINPGDSVRVVMQHMGKEGFEYYSSFSQVTGNGALQTISPANPNSNLSGGALGYFIASYTSTRRTIAR